MGSERELAKRIPKLWRKINPVKLGDLPTPVKRLFNLGEFVRHPALYIKRDDLSSQRYGGNKVRKLEFLLGQAKQLQKKTLVTMGGTGSNHLLATILHGQNLGLRTTGVVFPQPENEKVRKNIEAGQAAGVHLIKTPSKYLLPFYVARAMAQNKLRTGAWPYLIPGGGSSPLGALGFVEAGLELALQIQAGLLPEPEAIFVAYGTGGTAAGLSVGLQLQGLSCRVIAVRVIDRLLANEFSIKRFSRRIVDFLISSEDSIAVPARVAENLEVWHGYIGKGYGYPTQGAETAVELFRQHESISLEYTYTGKAASAFLSYAQRTRKPLLFWNTYTGSV